MAVEAQHLNLFLSQLIGNREINPNNMGLGVPLSGNPIGESLLPLYNSVQATTMVKTESGITNNLPVSRKRTRDSINPFESVHKDHRSFPFSFLGEEISFQIQQQQFEIDRFISHYTEKVRLEIAEHQKQHLKRVFVTVEQGIAKKLRSKEEEIEKIVKSNWVLEERVKSLCLENQIWRNLAHTNEATANALRSNFEQVLAQVKDECYGGAREDIAIVADDVESCGSCDFGEEEQRILVKDGGERNLVKDKERERNSNNNYNRWCRNCGKEESCVLLLPCRHLCLCKFCGPTLDTCPICKSTKTASVLVNLS